MTHVEDVVPVVTYVIGGMLFLLGMLVLLGMLLLVVKLFGGR